MADYRRSRVKGATYFLTLVTFHRRPLFAEESTVGALKSALRSMLVERPFCVSAMAVLPDHLHLMASLPDGDDYSTRVALLKLRFTKAVGAPPSLLPSRRRGEADVWQRRFWEHTVRDQDEFERVADYIHYNPVRHGCVKCPHAWRWSSFHRFVERGWLAPDWGRCCRRPVVPPKFDDVARFCGE